MLAHHTKKGSKLYNEDAADAQTLYAPADAHQSTPKFVHVLTVCDGHGHDGEGLNCAEYCIKRGVDWVTQLLTRDWTTINWSVDASTLTQDIHDAYRDICVKCPQFGRPRVIDEGVVLHNESGYDAVHSGSTFTLTLTFPWHEAFRTVIIQVGDSDVYVNGVCVECNHSADNPSEFIRLQAFPEAERHRLIFSMHGDPNIFLPNGEYNPRFYNVKCPSMPWRWNTGIKPSCVKYIPATYVKSPSTARFESQISMTRAIGDYFANAGGILPIPDVSILDTPTCPSIVVGSDGAWDTIDSDAKWIGDSVAMGVDLSTCLSPGHPLSLVLEKRVEALSVLFAEKFGKGNVDDISMAVLLP